MSENEEIVSGVLADIVTEQNADSKKKPNAGPKAKQRPKPRPRPRNAIPTKKKQANKARFVRKMHRLKTNKPAPKKKKCSQCYK
jgi:hypothetical protein